MPPKKATPSKATLGTKTPAKSTPKSAKATPKGRVTGSKRGRAADEEGNNLLEEDDDDDDDEVSASENDDEDDNDDEDEDDDNEDEEEDEDEEADEEEEEEPPSKRRASTARTAKATPAKSPLKKETASATKKAAATKKTAATSKSSSAKAKEVSDSVMPTKLKRGKALKPTELIDLAMKAYKWWEDSELPENQKWRFMEHCGLVFPPAYVPHGVKMQYDGKDVDLTPAQEEIATYYAAIGTDSPQLTNPTTARVFNRNFFKDFLNVLGPNHTIQKFELCNFDPIRVYLKNRTEARKALSKEEKEALKDEKLVTQLRHGYVLVDGHIERMGNYNVEPPSLFRGRGEHPKMGILKRRIQPEDITINVAHTAAVPICPIPGHNWKRVVHDPSVTWLAYWMDVISGGFKYVFLAASSSFKGRSDLVKYETARRLKTHIARIRAHYERLLSSSDPFEQQSGTALWIIDRLALRVGGEKDADEADTVGCCSLRVEHIQLSADALEYQTMLHRNRESAGSRASSSLIMTDVQDLSSMSSATSGQAMVGPIVTFDFLGKDSMRYFNSIDLNRYGETGRTVFNNLKNLTRGKKPDEDIFDILTPSRLNEQLSALMPGLSAKVFRTYNASVTLESELRPVPVDTPLAEKLLEYNRANREVAILCNHQKSVNPKTELALNRQRERVEQLRSQYHELQFWLTQALDKDKSKAKAKLGISDDCLKRSEAQLAQEVKEIVERRRRDLADVPATSVNAFHEENETKLAHKWVKDSDAHRFPKHPTVEMLQMRVINWKEKLDKAETEFRNKDENKSVALGTSKINYMDPRITVTWCKKVECPIEKVFPKTLVDKFPWAMGAKMDFTF